MERVLIILVCGRPWAPTWAFHRLWPFCLFKKWHPDVTLLKEDVSMVPVWVKLHGVPVTAFTEDGLSAIDDIK
ncbi:copia protein [Tanacetum coccineum]